MKSKKDSIVSIATLVVCLIATLVLLCNNEALISNLKKEPLLVGDTWKRCFDEGNPFDKNCFTTTISDLKDGYVEFYFLNPNFSSSMKESTFRFKAYKINTEKKGGNL